MDVAVDLYLAIPLLFAVLALILTSVFVRPQGAEEVWSWELVAAEAARESSPGDQAAVGAGLEPGRERLPVEEVGAAEQWEEAVEKQSPDAKPSPAAAENIPQQPPTEPHEPEPQEDVESKIPPSGASVGSSLGHLEQVEDAGDHAAFPTKAEEEDLDSGKEKLVVGEPASTAAAPAPVTSTAVLLQQEPPEPMENKPYK
ncbi:eukaryotic translation initiation factor 3 subunit B-like [Pezoporus wallicus]|uniref:eukaryotic translation initiation factor 3 subunit B-like n=1 Tax=Pezoporus wallicus TaxID=35540 RepID=UPI00254CFBD5|nr:eukaryotic translation initiation factor 3 subunit B-like [Pezoporus wallicus]XP_061324785.1 eukaryotic translation initiation factor 3 subunit B-like [Pezoporus flaviventris]